MHKGTFRTTADTSSVEHHSPYNQPVTLAVAASTVVMPPRRRKILAFRIMMAREAAATISMVVVVVVVTLQMERIMSTSAAFLHPSNCSSNLCLKMLEYF